jgi:hypothetical protein
MDGAATHQLSVVRWIHTQSYCKYSLHAQGAATLILPLSHTFPLRFSLSLWNDKSQSVHSTRPNTVSSVRLLRWRKEWKLIEYTYILNKMRKVNSNSKCLFIKAKEETKRKKKFKEKKRHWMTVRQMADYYNLS